VTQWLRAFMDAKMIITDSFHGCVFSIIFNKPFWVVGNSERGNARFDSLLKTFNLEERLIDINKFQIQHLNKEIDWMRVNDIISSKRGESLNYLYKNL
jgi:exopolysaccharide biosynthesis predicted pyruvyltransferase EpsI